MANHNHTETPRKRSLFVKIMAWALSILMACSTLGLLISVIVELASKA